MDPKLTEALESLSCASDMLTQAHSNLKEFGYENIPASGLRRPRLSELVSDVDSLIKNIKDYHGYVSDQGAA